eukprot:15027492-Alexandrium_andersonii.AAC.1
MQTQKEQGRSADGARSISPCSEAKADEGVACGVFYADPEGDASGVLSTGTDSKRKGKKVRERPRRCRGRKDRKPPGTEPKRARHSSLESRRRGVRSGRSSQGGPRSHR